MNLETQKTRKQRGIMTESDNYGWEWYDVPSKNHLVATLFPRVTYLLGDCDTHQAEIRQKV
jgi:hypothetical protein